MSYENEDKVIEANEDKVIEALENLAEYMNKQIKPDQLEHYLKRLKGMPHGFVIRYCDDCMNENPPGVPSRFPSVNDIEKRYREVGSPGQGSMTSHDKTKCPDCYGEGLLWWLIDTGSGNIERFGKCGACSNWRQHILPPDLPTVHRKDLVQQGYLVFPYDF